MAKDVTAAATAHARGKTKPKRGTHDDVPGVLVPADVRAEEDERTFVLRVHGVDRLQTRANGGGLRVCVFSCRDERRVVFKGGCALCGRIFELGVHFPPLTLEGMRECCERESRGV